MEHNEDTRWIAERAKCDMGAFLRDVCSLAKQNVQAMNQECHKRGWSSFDYTPYREHPLTFYIEPQEKDRRCTFAYDEGHHVINVTMVGPDCTYTIHTRWDTETLQCRVVVQCTSGTDADTTEFLHDALGKAVACVLELFFFPDRPFSGGTASGDG